MFFDQQCRAEDFAELSATVVRYQISLYALSGLEVTAAQDPETRNPLSAVPVVGIVEAVVGVPRQAYLEALTPNDVVDAPAQHYITHTP